MINYFPFFFFSCNTTLFGAFTRSQDGYIIMRFLEKQSVGIKGMKSVNNLTYLRFISFASFFGSVTHIRAG
jgi:hypothetical protein